MSTFRKYLNRSVYIWTYSVILQVAVDLRLFLYFWYLCKSGMKNKSAFHLLFNYLKCMRNCQFPPKLLYSVLSPVWEDELATSIRISIRNHENLVHVMSLVPAIHCLTMLLSPLISRTRSERKHVSKVYFLRRTTLRFLVSGSPNALELHPGACCFRCRSS